jgi:hypothetical protein
MTATVFFEPIGVQYFAFQTIHHGVLLTNLYYMQLMKMMIDERLLLDILASSERPSSDRIH